MEQHILTIESIKILAQKCNTFLQTQVEQEALSELHDKVSELPSYISEETTLPKVDLELLQEKMDDIAACISALSGNHVVADEPYVD